MKKLSLVISTALLSSTIALTSLPASANLPFAVGGQTLPSLAPMLEEVTPAVVLISVKGTHEVKDNVPEAFKFFFGDPRNRGPQQEKEFRGLGSGVIIDSDEGYIVTNNHVIAEASEIVVTLKDGRQLEAKKIGSDEYSDIALLQIDHDDLTEIKLADSDNIRVGDFAIAIGRANSYIRYC